MVRQEGLEPTPRKGLEPKSSASTSFATGAQAGDYTKLFRLAGAIALFFQLDSCGLVTTGSVFRHLCS